MPRIEGPPTGTVPALSLRTSLTAAWVALAGLVAPIPVVAQVDQATLESISTPDAVDTSIGTLHFFDGAPLPETAQSVYDYLDRMRGVDTFLKGIPAASVYALLQGIEGIGADAANKVVLLNRLMTSDQLFLTANTTTIYVLPNLDLKRDGPTVVEIPPGALGAFNDAYFRYVEDVGPAGPDQGRGGRYLVLPPGFEGEVPTGFHVVRSPSYRLLLFFRVGINDGLEVALDGIKSNMRIFPLSKAASPPAMEWINGSDVPFNTVHANDFHFYEELNAVIQYEPIELLNPETRGLFASIGIEKGKTFDPDARMRALLEDAIAIGNAAARSIVWYPRENGNMASIRIWDDRQWVEGFLDKNVFFNGADGFTMNSDARVMFHYPYTGVTPAMSKPRIGAGSDYGIAFVDAEGQPFDGSKTYKMTLPENVPAANFWAVTLYDNQTRSLPKTGQTYPSIDSVTGQPKMNEDGSIDLYFSPEPPQGQENNWVQTVPGKGWFSILRIYGPLEPWMEQTWRPSDIQVLN